MKKFPKSIICLFWGLDVVLAGLLVYLLLRPAKPDLHPENYQMQEAPEYVSTLRLIENLMGNPFFVLSADRMDRLGPYELWEEINGVQWLKEREDATIYLFRSLYDEMRTRQSWRDGDSNVEQYRLTALLTFLKQPIYYDVLSSERQKAVDQCVKNLKKGRYIPVKDSALDRVLKVTEIPHMPETYYCEPEQIDDALMEEIQQAIQQNRWIRQAWKKPDLSRPIRVRPTESSDEIEFYYIFLQTDTEQFGLFLSVYKLSGQIFVDAHYGGEYDFAGQAFQVAAALATEEKPMQVYSFSRGVVFVVGGRLINVRGGPWGERNDLSQEIIDAVGEELKKEGQ